MGLTTLTHKKYCYRSSNEEHIIRIRASQGPVLVQVGSKRHRKIISTNREALNTAKPKIRIGFWIVHIMYATSEFAKKKAEMRRYKFHVLGVSENKWIQGECEQQQVEHSCILVDKMDIIKGLQLSSKRGSKSL